MREKIIQWSILTSVGLILGCQTPSDETNAGGQAGDGYSTVKPGAAVALDYTVEGETESGTPVSVLITLTSANAASTLQLSLSSDDSLQLADDQARADFQNVQPGVINTHRIQVTPQRNGRLYLNAIVTVQSSGGRSARTFSVPIQVGPEASAQDDPPAGDEDGVISLPAEET